MPDHAWAAFQPVMWADAALTAVTGYFALRLFQRRATGTLAGVVFGAWLYATAYTIGWAMAIDAPLVGPVSMIVPFAGFGLILYDMVSTRGAGAV